MKRELKKLSPSINRLSSLGNTKIPFKTRIGRGGHYLFDFRGPWNRLMSQHKYSGEGLMGRSGPDCYLV